MLKLTRRGLIKQASIGAGAVGVLTATLSAETHARASSLVDTTDHSALKAGEALVVYITHQDADTLTIMRGEKEIKVKNAALTKHLLSL